MDDLPAVGHAVSVRIVGTRVHELEVRKAARRGCAVNRNVAITHGRGQRNDFPRQTSLVLHAVNRCVISSEGPESPLRADEQFISGWVNGVNVVGVFGEFSVNAWMDVETAVFDEIIVQIQFVQPGRRSKPKGLSVGR